MGPTTRAAQLLAKITLPATLVLGTIEGCDVAAQLEAEPLGSVQQASTSGSGGTGSSGSGSGSGSGECFYNSDCDDGVDCTRDLCLSGIWECDNWPDHDRCDDGDPCTTNRCNASSGCEYTPDYPVIGAELDALRDAATGSFQQENAWRADLWHPPQYKDPWDGPDPDGNACNASGTPMNCSYGLSCKESVQRTDQAFGALGLQCWSCSGETRSKTIAHGYGKGYQDCSWSWHWHTYDHEVEICSNSHTGIEKLWDNWGGKGDNGVDPGGFRSAYPD